MNRSPLVNRKELVRQLEDHQRDAGAVNVADAVAGPTAVAGLHSQKLVARAREIFIPVLIAGLVEGLRCVEVRVVIVPAALAPLALLLIELLLHIIEAGIG